MSQCPTCDSKIDSSFGLKNCPKCGSLVFVNVDGSVEVASTDAGGESQENEIVAVPEVALPNEPSQAEKLESFWTGNLENHDDNKVGVKVAEAQGGDLSVGKIGAPPFEVGSNTENLVPRDPLKEVEAFGNSEESSGQDGAMTFDVSIAGIDSIKAKKDLRDALADKRFMWETDVLLRAIKNGTLQIRGISAVKASVLIHRLKEQPLELKWTQRTLVTKPPEGI